MKSFVCVCVLLFHLECLCWTGLFWPGHGLLWFQCSPGRCCQVIPLNICSSATIIENEEHEGFVCLFYDTLCLHILTLVPLFVHLSCLSHQSVWDYWPEQRGKVQASPAGSHKWQHRRQEVFTERIACGYVLSPCSFILIVWVVSTRISFHLINFALNSFVFFSVAAHWPNWMPPRTRSSWRIFLSLTPRAPPLRSSRTSISPWSLAVLRALWARVVRVRAPWWVY